MITSAIEKSYIVTLLDIVFAAFERREDDSEYFFLADFLNHHFPKVPSEPYYPIVTKQQPALLLYESPPEYKNRFLESLANIKMALLSRHQDKAVEGNLTKNSFFIN